MAAQVANDASQRGQKEVFDVSALSTVLKATRDDQLTDQYMKPLMKALDSLGRMLMSFFWHGEQFAERYGDAEMPELEDSLRNTFEDLGTLIQAIDSKTVDANPTESAGDIELSEVADQ
jgi:hypothetical protein